MPFQSGSNLLVALKRETTPGTAAGATGGTRLRINGGPGLTKSRAVVQSGEKRSDGLRSMGRLGYISVGGSYDSELSAGGGTDILLEAIMRSTWVAAVTRTYDNSAGLTSLQITDTDEITQVGTTTLLGVVFVGDIIYLSNMSTAANNGINLRVVSVTATVIIVAGAPLTVQAADTACTLTVRKKVKTATTPVNYAHTVEQYYTDIDVSEQFLGVYAAGVRLAFRPGQMALVSYALIGMDGAALASGASPYFTTPTLSTTLGLIADDSSIRLNGAEIAKLTGLELNFTIPRAGEPVIGANVTPAVFSGDLTVEASATMLREDLSNFTLYDAETEFELHTLLQEPTGTPPACLSFFLPRVKIQGPISAPLGGDTGMIETIPLMVGPKVAATGYDAGIATISSSEA